MKNELNASILRLGDKGAVLPKVTFIVPTRNRTESLASALESIAAQRTRIDVVIEIVVVNDAGELDTNALHRWAESLAVVLVNLDRRVGPAAARNAGLRIARGAYIAFLDDDDIISPEHLATGLPPLERDDADFVYMGAVVSEKRLRSVPVSREPHRLKAYPFDSRALQVVNYIHTGSVIVRNATECGHWFDDRLDVCEDWDLWLRLVFSSNYRVRYIDKVTSVYHQIPSTQGLVSGAQLTAPSIFTLARRRIHAKWPVEDSLVGEWRSWISSFECSRDELISDGVRMPNLLFDDVLSFSHHEIRSGNLPRVSDIARFFPDA